MNNTKLIEAVNSARNEVQTAIENGKDVSKMVSISYGNNKMGKIPSVSLLPILTCPARCNGTCGDKCYAKKLAILRPSVMKSYARNTAVFMARPFEFFQAVERVMATSQYFRFHVSGDIPNGFYLAIVAYLANNNPFCKVLMFTKQYELVNDFIRDNGSVPENLKILFSGWTNLKPVNPYNLPETTVYAKDEDFRPEWKACGGNCLDCALHCGGCWEAKNGETVAFKIH